MGAGQTSDLRWVEESARQVAKFSSGHTIVVEKSTLPVRTAEVIQSILEAEVIHSKEEISKRIKDLGLDNDLILSLIHI